MGKKLIDCEIGKEYNITEIQTNDKNMESFLFTLGCYPGEEITIVSLLSGTYTLAIMNSRYSVDKNLASAIIVE